MDEDFQRLMARKIGRRLRLVRRVRCFQLGELATRTGLTRQRLYRYETGNDRISICELKRLAAELCLPPEHFVEGCLLCGND